MVKRLWFQLTFSYRADEGPSKTETEDKTMKAMYHKTKTGLAGLYAGLQVRAAGYGRYLKIRLTRLLLVSLALLAGLAVAAFVWRRSATFRGVVQGATALPGLALGLAGQIGRELGRGRPATILQAMPAPAEGEEIPARPVPDGRL